MIERLRGGGIVALQLLPGLPVHKDPSLLLRRLGREQSLKALQKRCMQAHDVGETDRGKNGRTRRRSDVMPDG